MSQPWPAMANRKCVAASGRRPPSPPWYVRSPSAGMVTPSRPGQIFCFQPAKPARPAKTGALPKKTPRPLVEVLFGPPAKKAAPELAEPVSKNPPSDEPKAPTEVEAEPEPEAATVAESIAEVGSSETVEPDEAAAAAAAAVAAALEQTRLPIEEDEEREEVAEQAERFDAEQAR